MFLHVYGLRLPAVEHQLFGTIADKTKDILACVGKQLSSQHVVGIMLVAGHAMG